MLLTLTLTLTPTRTPSLTLTVTVTKTRTRTRTLLPTQIAKAQEVAVGQDAPALVPARSGGGYKPAPLPPGQPLEGASKYELDNVRKGTDGKGYRVVAGGGTVVGGKVLGANKRVWERYDPPATPSRQHTIG